MHTIKQTIIIVMLGFFALGVGSPSSYADTLSDLRTQCSQACHDVIVSPSGWVLSGIPGQAARTAVEKTLSGWESTIAAMGDGKCGFTTIGPGGTSRSVGAQYLLNKQYISPPTPTFTHTPTVTYTPTPTFMCIWASPVPTPTGGCIGGYVVMGAPYCPENVFVCFTPTATYTPTYTPTPTPTATSSGPHTWYDYDYQGGRCFQKDHTIQDKAWCEQHGKKGGGNHPSLDGYQRHAHLDYPGQKP